MTGNRVVIAKSLFRYDPELLALISARAYKRSSDEMLLKDYESSRVLEQQLSEARRAERARELLLRRRLNQPKLAS